MVNHRFWHPAQRSGADHNSAIYLELPSGEMASDDSLVGRHCPHSTCRRFGPKAAIADLEGKRPTWGR